MSDQVECAVVGAGVVGLAIARALALAGREVIVLEAADRAGTETTSRNSEVIHAGLYYPQGSLKARLCLAGRDALYRYCAERGIDHARLGKLVVATEPAQVASLERLAQVARGNGCTDVELLSGPEARALEPALRCAAALRSPSTGILDTHSYVQSLKAEAAAAGATFAFRTRVTGGRANVGAIELDVSSSMSASRLRCRHLVNAAGLHAHTLAAAIEGVPPATIPKVHYAKGSYFSLEGPSPFRRLIYPLPIPGGLGIHLTLDLAGRARFGPDVEWVPAIGYDVEPGRAAVFAESVRAYYPDLSTDRLRPAYAGIRPNLSGPRGATRDFLVQDASAHGVRGLVNLYGIDSPGLTASLALGDHVAALVPR